MESEKLQYSSWWTLFVTMLNPHALFKQWRKCTSCWWVFWLLLMLQLLKPKQNKKRGEWGGNPVLSVLLCIWFAQDIAFVENVARKVKAREEKVWTAAWSSGDKTVAWQNSSFVFSGSCSGAVLKWNVIHSYSDWCLWVFFLMESVKEARHRGCYHVSL